MSSSRLHDHELSSSQSHDAVLSSSQSHSDTVSSSHSGDDISSSSLLLAYKPRPRHARHSTMARHQRAFTFPCPALSLSNELCDNPALVCYLRTARVTMSVYACCGCDRSTNRFTLPFGTCGTVVFVFRTDSARFKPFVFEHAMAMFLCLDIDYVRKTSATVTLPQGGEILYGKCPMFYGPREEHLHPSIVSEYWTGRAICNAIKTAGSKLSAPGKPSKRTLDALQEAAVAVNVNPTKCMKGVRASTLHERV